MSLLILSGFEANGFAGLVKDVTVASQLGLKPGAIATCQTAQTSRSLQQINAPDTELLKAQLNSLIQIPLAIKIGLLPDKKTSAIIADWLATLTTKPFVVIDTVDSSSGDSQAFSTEPLATRLDLLLPFANLLTPNLNELDSLINQSFIEQTDAGFKCHQHSSQLLIKGGHELASDQYVTDRLFDSNGIQIAQWSQKKISANARGTGCHLSTAIAGCYALGYNLLDSITLANENLNRTLTQYRPFSGLPMSPECFPIVSRTKTTETAIEPFLKLEKERGLYPVVDSAAWVERLADTGISTIQLRVKNQPVETVKDEIVKAVKIAREKNLQLFINDYWQLAIEFGAYGVHLGQEDLEEADLTAIRTARLRLGISTHGDFEFCLAKQMKPTYLAVGAVYPTTTKDMSGQIQGMQRLARYVKMSDNIPVVAIGGINRQRLPDILETQVPIIAAVSAVTNADDPERTAREWEKRISCDCLNRLSH